MAPVPLSRVILTSNRISNILRTTTLQRPQLTELTLRQPPIVSSVGSWPSILQSFFHTYKFTNNVSFASEHKIAKPKNFQILKDDSIERPIILFFSWLNAKDKNCQRYIKIYTDLGYDVLKVAINPGDLWRPVNRMHGVAADVTDFLEINKKYSQILIHGMSVGAYAFCEIMYKMSQDRKRYQPVLNRFVGQIWDSPVDVHNAPMGTSASVTDNPHLQKVIQRIFTKFMEWKYDDITYYYYRASDIFHSNFINAPSLFIVSKIDPVSDLHTNNIIVKKWSEKGAQVDMLCFEKSPHVLHLLHHKEEYERAVVGFLRKVLSVPPVQATLPEEKLKADIALELA